MIKLGLVDLCTSHCESWYPIIEEMAGFEVTAVYDGGGCRPEEFCEQYAEQRGIPHVCQSVEEVVELVDAGIVWSANWDLHLPHGRPFIEAGKPVFLDKPTVGNLRDLNELLTLEAKYKSLIMVGSSCRYCYEVQELLAEKEEMGEIATAWVQGPGDFFNYGIHTIELFQGFFGGGVRFVRHCARQGSTDIFLAQYGDGPAVMFQLGSPCHQWVISITAQEGVWSKSVDSSNIYRALIEKYFAAIKSGEPPWPLATQLESIKIMLAAKMARRAGGDIYLEDVPESEYFDGNAFGAEYARVRKYGA